jgi:phage-related protein
MIEYYTDAHGRSPVEDFVNELPVQDQVAVARLLSLLEEFGTSLGRPYVRYVEGKLWELRPRAVRLLYFAHTGRRFVILHAFRKKSRKTPRKHISIAQRRLAEFLEREG